MKKLLLVAAGMMLASSFSYAGIISAQCSFVQVGPSNPTGGTDYSTTVSCPGLTAGTLPAGDTLISVEYYAIADYSGGHTGTNTVDYYYGTPSAGSGWGGPNTPTFECIETGTGTAATTGQSCNQVGSTNTTGEWTTTTTGLSGNTFPTFTVTVTADVVGGAVTAVTASGFIEYDYTVPSPEPASLMMVGGGIGLLGLAQFAGKYLKKKRS